MNNIEEILSTQTTNKAGEKYLYALNGKLFYSIDSKNIYSNRFKDNFLKENSIYVITGTDSGLFIKYLINKKIPQGSLVVFIEFKPVIEWLFKNHEITLPNKIELIDHEEFKEKLQLAGIKEYIYINKLHYIPSFAVQDGHNEEYIALGKQIAEYLQSLHWETASQIKNHLFLTNQFKNAADNIVHASCFFNRFKGKSALLLAGGPSLDDYIPWIQSHRNKYTILAVSRISRRLIHANITPDFIFSVDPQGVSLDVSREMFHFSKHSVFIHSYHAFHPMVAQWAGRKAYLGPLLPWPSPLNIFDRTSGGATVTNTALACALEMGFSKIVLCGVDLCYAPNGLTHASCSKNFELGPVVEGAEASIETNTGKLAETTHAYAFAARHIEFLANHEMAKDTSIFNPNPNAARINGVIFQDIDKINAGDLNKTDAVNHFFNNDDTDIHFDKILTELSNKEKEFKEIIRLSKRAIKENIIFFQGKINSFSIAKKNIDEIEKKLHSDELDSSTNFVKAFGIERFLNVVHMKGKDEITNREAEKSINKYYTSFLKSSNDILNIIDEIKKKIVLRKEERKEHPNYKTLADFYKKESTPGRCRVLLEKTESDDTIDAKIRLLLTELENTFTQYIDGSWSYSKIYLENWNEWTEEKESRLITRALSFFQEKNAEEMERIVQVLGNSTAIGMDKLRQFIHGLRAESQGYHDEALHQYNQVVEDSHTTNPYLLESTLKRIASISIADRDMENGLLALQCLTDMSIQYAPQYAKMLKLTNNTNDALDVYAGYVERFPNDTRTMLEMATLYGELSIKEGVQLLTGYILERDPENITAQQLRDAHAQ